ncbi:MAG: DUF2075 domain-containing protein, partial [Actinomycetota bacterium]|nr:DUF2075 domain-containing protein [Actinomycetota bacterium]
MSGELVADLVRRLVERLGGRWSRGLGIDVDEGDEEVDRWALAATLFGNRISAAVVERTMGGHSITKQYAPRRSVDGELRTAEELPPTFRIGHKDPFFPARSRHGPKRLATWGPEVSPEWLYFLDDEQMSVCDKLIAEAEDVLAADNLYQVHFILGGPGTGKTSILLQILRRLSTQVETNVETWSVGLR